MNRSVNPEDSHGLNDYEDQANQGGGALDHRFNEDASSVHRGRRNPLQKKPDTDLTSRNLQNLLKPSAHTTEFDNISVTLSQLSRSHLSSTSKQAKQFDAARRLKARLRQAEKVKQQLNKSAEFGGEAKKEEEEV